MKEISFIKKYKKKRIEGIYGGAAMDRSKKKSNTVK